MAEREISNTDPQQQLLEDLVARDVNDTSQLLAAFAPYEEMYAMATAAASPVTAVVTAAHTPA